MNTEDKIAEQAAEIARLGLVLAERQAKIGELMGEAARAGIAGAPASVPQGDLSDDGIVKVLASFGIDADKSKYGFPELQVSTNVPGIRKIVAAYLAAAPDVAPLPAHPKPAGQREADLPACDECAGTGKCGPDDNPNEMDCEVCEGSGRYQQSDTLPLNRYVWVSSGMQQVKTNMRVCGEYYSAGDVDEILSSVSSMGGNVEAAAKAIYRLFDGAEAHPWRNCGNSNKQDEARRYARAAIEVSTPAYCVGGITSKESAEPPAPGASIGDKQ